MQVKYPPFWGTVDYIRRNYRWAEICFGTRGLLRIVRELMVHFEYSMKKNGLNWTREHWYEHINEYLIEEREKCYATQDYLLAFEEYDFLRDQFAEH